MPPSRDCTDIENALAIAYEAHYGQKTFGGHPYIFHPIRIMEQMHTDTERCVALLHDTVEDTDITFEYLAKWFSPAVVEAVVALTRPEYEGEKLDFEAKAKQYHQYIENQVVPNRLAAKVKLADLRDNIRIERLPKITKGALARTKKYHKAIQRLLHQSYSPEGRLS